MALLLFLAVVIAVPWFIVCTIIDGLETLAEKLKN